jgi:hypothetical protein
MLGKGGGGWDGSFVPRVCVWFFSEIILSTNLYRMQLHKVALFGLKNIQIFCLETIDLTETTLECMGFG